MERDNDYTDFVRKLIGAVQKRKCIYNKKHTTYYNKQEREKAWCQVAAEVGQSAGACQKRWKLLREKYAKEIKKRDRAFANGENYHSNWSCFTKIDFIEDHIIPRSKKFGKSRYFFVPSYRENTTNANNDDDQSNKSSLLHSTSDCTHEQQPEQSIGLTHFQSTVKQQCSDELNDYATSENSTLDSDHIEIKEEPNNIQLANINDMVQQQDKIDMLGKSEAMSVQHKLHEWLNANRFNPLYAAEKAKQDQFKTLPKEDDDSDALFGKMVTNMLKEIHLEDVKDDAKLHILQLLIKAKRVTRNSTQD